MPYPVKGLLEVYEDMVEILLMLQVFLAENPEIEYLFGGAPFGSETACSSANSVELVSTHKICLYGEIVKIIPKLSSNTHLICSTISYRS